MKDIYVTGRNAESVELCLTDLLLVFSDSYFLVFFSLSPSYHDSSGRMLYRGLRGWKLRHVFIYAADLGRRPYGDGAVATICG